MKTFGGLSLVKTKMFIACVFAWVITVGFVSSYMVYLYMQRLRLRNNMCIILGISHKRNVSWLEYIVQVAVVTFNASCVLVLTTCTLGLYFLTVHSTRNVPQLSKRSYHDAKNQKLLIRILLLVLCNIICWIPILLICILLLFDIAIHENIINWMVVLIIPISSTTNPFLYNIHIIKDRIRALMHQ